jgi:hypothetical protein
MSNTTKNIYRIYNQGEIPQLASGYRAVIALHPGRKWIVLVDWSTLETAKVEIATWERMKPQPVDFRLRPVIRAMKERLKYVAATQSIKDAMATIRPSGESEAA